MMISLVALIIGFCADLIFGDPRFMPHPVRFIGLLIEKTEKILRSTFPKTPKGEYLGGAVLCVFVVAVSAVIPMGILFAANQISPLLRLAIESFMCYQILATKALKDESMKVYDKLCEKDIDGARKMVSMIVGRDTQNLDEPQIAKAAVETVAENASDGVVAPMIFISIGGASIGFLYKAVNTLDSMVGYKNDKYISFGRFSAKTDDVFNLIPARLCSFLMMGAAFLLGMDYKSAYKIYYRDRYNHTSPNSANTEAVCAGALNIQLAGDSYYFGKLHEKPTIGDNIREISVDDIKKVNKLMYMTAFLSIVILSVIKYILI